MNKRILQSVLSVVFLLTLSVFANASVILGGPYWGFEEDAIVDGDVPHTSAAWWIQHALSYSVVNKTTGVVRTGDRSLKFSSTGVTTPAMGFVQSSPLLDANSKVIEGAGTVWFPSPGRFAVQFWIYVESGTLDGKFLMVCPGTQALAQAYGDWVQADVDVSEAKQGEWVKVTSGFFQNGGNTNRDFIKSVLRFNYTSKSGVTYYVDDIVILEEKDIPIEYPTAANLKDYYSFERPNQGTADEAKAEFWLTSKAVFSISTTQAHHGTKSLKYTCATPAPAFNEANPYSYIASLTNFKSSRFNIVEGGAIAECWVYKESDVMGDVYIQLMQDGNNVYRVGKFNTSNIAKNVWTKVTTDVLALKMDGDPVEAGVQGPQVQIYYPKDSPAATFYIDEINVRSVNSTATPKVTTNLSKVYSNGKQITVISKSGNNIKIINTLGQIILNSKLVSDTQTFTVPTNGVQFVCIDNETPVKVIVK